VESEKRDLVFSICMREFERVSSRKFQYVGPISSLREKVKEQIREHVVFAQKMMTH